MEIKVLGASENVVAAIEGERELNLVFEREYEENDKIMISLDRKDAIYQDFHMHTHFCDGKNSPEEMISHTFFVNNTKLFYEFYKSKMIYENARPNKAHLFFADLEKCGKDVRIVTQNIDSLHTMAGNKRVFEIHGSVKRNYCIRCSEFYDEKYILESKDIPYCKKCGGIVKPDVVLYEEGLDDKTVQGAVNAIQCADLLIIIGTSLAVYPAASFIKFFGGEKIVLINKSETSFDKKDTTFTFIAWKHHKVISLFG